MKAVIILRSGAEISIVTSSMEIVRGHSGSIKRVRFDDHDQFVRYLNPDDISCVLSYPEDEKREEMADE
ncbi:MAG: hypothetical protein PHY12_05805 [Eubacteriales bacterium]|nr:hypothetical protein [Eubacteriales bacterium]